MLSKNSCIFLHSITWSLIISPYHMWCTDCCLKSLKRKAKHVYSFHSVENMALSFWQYMPSSVRSAQKRSWANILSLSSWTSFVIYRVHVHEWKCWQDILLPWTVMTPSTWDCNADWSIWLGAFLHITFWKKNTRMKKSLFHIQLV